MNHSNVEILSPPTGKTSASMTTSDKENLSLGYHIVGRKASKAQHIPSIKKI